MSDGCLRFVASHKLKCSRLPVYKCPCWKTGIIKKRPVNNEQTEFLLGRYFCLAEQSVTQTCQITMKWQRPKNISALYKIRLLVASYITAVSGEIVYTLKIIISGSALMLYANIIKPNSLLLCYTTVGKEWFSAERWRVRACLHLPVFLWKSL